MDFLKKLISKNKFEILFFLFLTVHIFLSLVLKFTAWPEMLTYPWLIQKGFRFYGDIIHPYLPLLPYFLLGFYSIFGLSLASLHILTIIFFLFSDFLIFLISKKLYGIRLAFISLLFYIPLQLFFEGNGLWFDSASVPIILLAFYLLLNNKETKNWKINTICSLIGLAVIIKQTNIVFLLPIIIYLQRFRRSYKSLLLVFLPLVLLTVYYLNTAEFKDFLYWGLVHPLFVQSRIPGFIIFPSIRQLLVVVFILSSGFIFFQKKSDILLWFFLSLIFVIPRFGYFHLQPGVAFLSLLFPELIKKQHRYFLFLLFYSLGIGIIIVKFIVKDIGKPIRFFEPETIKVRQTILDFGINEPIFFLNVPSQYFVMTNLRVMNPWADTFPWYLEVPGEQEKIISKLKVINYVIFSPFGNEGKFELGSYKPTLIAQYIDDNFTFFKNINSSIELLKRKELGY